MTSPKTTQQHLEEAREVLNNIGQVQRFFHSEGKQSQIPSNLAQTETGIQEYIKFVESNEQSVTSALASPQTQTASGASGNRK